MKSMRLAGTLLLAFFVVTSAPWADEGVLSADEIKYLNFMREEEKLARDVYLVLYQEWGAEVFANIALSEQQHTDAVRDLIDAYGLQDPVVNDSIGVFVAPELAQLYETLVERGRESIVEALYVGALIEEVDMEDIQHAIDVSDDNALLTVYDNLMRGSRNHLRAFVPAVEMLTGDQYEAQYLDQETMDEILSIGTETGG